MKIAVIIARILLGLMFLVFGLNGILHFMPATMPPGTPQDAITFGTILATSKWMTFVSVLMMISGLLILVGRFVPLALTILAPIIVNILCFHIFLMHGGGTAPGLVAALLELFLMVIYRSAFYSLFIADLPPAKTI